MGHTVRSQRQMVDIVLQELEDYMRALRPQERERVRGLLASALKRVGAIGFASSMQVWALVLLSVIIDCDKRIARLEQASEKETR